MLNDYAQSGQLPKWSEDNGESYIMVGDPADSIIADAYAFGAKDFNETGAGRHGEPSDSPSNIRPGLADYEKDGYLPIDGNYGCCNFYGPVSTQEEYNTADNSIALLAADLGDCQVAQDFRHPGAELAERLQPGKRVDGAQGDAGAIPARIRPDIGVGFVEADSYVYTAMVPFDLAASSQPPAATLLGSIT